MIVRRWRVNGAPCRVRVEPRWPLLRVLREVIGLTGAKEGCGEGECGACLVLLNGRPVTACLVAAGAVLDDAEVLTIEGLAETPLGRTLLDAFVEHGAVQCGICIPGMVVAAWALLAESPRPTEDEVREAISGNLCRCTGYAKIVSAIRAAAERAAGLPPPSPPRGPAPVAARGSEDFHTPATLAEALEIRARHPGCVVLAGGTDLMVAGIPSRRPVLALEAIAELVVLREGAGGLEIGAATRVELLARDPLVARLAPGLAEAARQLGARGIRERATMGGNLANASPAADLAPPLCAAGATLRLAARDRRREVPIAAFYRGYKDCDLAPDELLIGVALPPLAPGAREGFRKLGTRRAQSIAKISVAARVTVTAGRIAEIGLAAGSVAPTVVRLVRTEAALRGERPGSDLPERAGNLAAAEVAPIDDVRSTADYRRAMVGVLVADLLRALATE